MKKVETIIQIQCSPEDVIHAFTDGVQLNGWWGVERALVEKRPGGVYALSWEISEQGIKYLSTGVIRDYLPQYLIHIEKMMYFNPEKQILGPMELIVHASPKNDGAEVTITQLGYQSGDDWDWYYKAVQEAWPKAAQTLKAYLENEA